MRCDRRVKEYTSMWFVFQTIFFLSYILPIVARYCFILLSSAKFTSQFTFHILGCSMNLHISKIVGNFFIFFFSLALPSLVPANLAFTRRCGTYTLWSVSDLKSLNWCATHLSYNLYLLWFIFQQIKCMFNLSSMEMEPFELLERFTFYTGLNSSQAQAISSNWQFGKTMIWTFDWY